MTSLGENPEATFAGMKLAVEQLPEEFMQEKSRFLQLAVELDVDPKRKIDLITGVLNKEISDYGLENSEEKVVAFDLLIEQVGTQQASEVLRDSSVKGELRKLLEGAVSSRKPASASNN